MGLIEAGLKYRKITLMFFIMAVILGIISFINMPRFEDPQIKVFMAQVQTVYPGASPEQVEALVTKPLEEKIDELKEVSKITSSSANGFSNIMVEIAPESDQKKAWDNMRQKVNEARLLLPSGAGEPEVNDEVNKTSCLIIHLIPPANLPVASIREIADDWKDSIKQVPGVEKIEVMGLPEQQVQIILDPSALAARRLSWTHLADALQKRNVSIPGGTLREGETGFMVEPSGEYSNLEEIKDTIIYQPVGGTAVKVKDVASVKLVHARNDVLVKSSDNSAVALAIFPKEGHTVFDVNEKVQAKIKEMKKDLPSGVEVQSVYDQSESVKKKFDELWRELLTGMGMVLLICVLGLHWQTAVMTALAIPVSVAVGFGPLASMGVDLQQMSLAALIIALGILVDDAIVVNDNIERHILLETDRYTAVLSGTREVAVSILTSTIATVAGFIPLILLRGNIGEFIRSLPLVVAVTMSASMVVSLWLVPIMRYWTAGRVKKNIREKAFGQSGPLGPFLNRLSTWYEALLSKCLKLPFLTVTVALLVSASTFMLIPIMGIQFFPYAEKSEFIIDINTPKSSSLHETEAVVGQVVRKVKEQIGVKEVFVYIGHQLPKFYYNELSGGRGETLTQLLVVSNQEPKETHQLAAKLRGELTGAIPGSRVTVRELEQGPPVGPPVSIRIKGDDLSELRTLADQVIDILKQVPGTVNVHDDMGSDTYSVKVNSSPELTARWGVAEKDIANSVRMAVDGLEISNYRKGDKLYPIVLRTSEAEDASLSNMSSIWVPSWKTGSILPLAQVATVDVGWNTGTINRHNLKRVINARAYTDGTLPDNIIKAASAKIAAIPIPKDYKIEYGGENEERDLAFAKIGKLSIVVLLLIYVIIAIQFYSLTKPAVILLSVFLAISGAVLGLYVTGTPLGFMALLGVVSLSGIVVRNGIMLVEFIEVGLKQELPLYGAILEAGKVRLRPILLTAATAVSALLPMAITGGSLWRPMAVSIISGLIFSTVLTLIVVPSVYLLITKRKLAG
ncbi:acriflavin resistance protein [Desulfofarcimen acetoxidans DSM 771]|uniref:Acriflavin resistance protein n=1 Tax=Desulfofarcimen acetoxidans (strain ATCC 49208 / DSM 771 / KCTC 5769 / VKM B-1644 / 5575) TaxID=485916 RepID=C8VY84_DESAS|nr:efflux RND transporter permease subunit [Desulfofarcimen acetoxidans]ACV62765.1 acriflavin resistance protein [Desulfofarcimen acetoxidans DSM 771]